MKTLFWLWLINITLPNSALWSNPIFGYQYLDTNGSQVSYQVEVRQASLRVAIDGNWQGAAGQAACNAFIAQEKADGFAELTSGFQLTDMDGNVVKVPYAQLNPKPDAQCTEHYVTDSPP